MGLHWLDVRNELKGLLHKHLEQVHVRQEIIFSLLVLFC